METETWPDLLIGRVNLIGGELAFMIHATPLLCWPRRPFESRTQERM